MGTLAQDFDKADWSRRDPGTGAALPHSRGRVAVAIVTGASGETNSLAAPVKPFQSLLLYCRTHGGGNRVITVASAYDEAGSTALTFSAAGQFVKLVSVETSAGVYAWRVDSYDGVTGPTVAMASISVTAATITTLTSPLTVSAANTAASYQITDGTTALIALDSRNTIANVNGVTVTSPPTTIATAAAAHLNPSLKIANKTITYTGTATVTSQLGGMLNVGVLTLTDAGAGTVSLASAVHINAVAAAGGSLTLTAARMISTSVADCYLTNAGVFTDTACWGYGKRNVVSVTQEAIGEVLSKITPRKWRYNPETHGDDGVERLGIMYDDLPNELVLPGPANAEGRRGVSAGLLASFSLAVIKTLWDRVETLEAKAAA